MDRTSRAGAAGALAALLLRVADAGIELRGRGECAAADRGELGHLLRGHDDGCRALGLSERGIASALRRWDRAGAAELLLEAVHDAIAEIAGSAASATDGGSAASAMDGVAGATGQAPDGREMRGWSAEAAREALRYAVELRITPTADRG